MFFNSEHRALLSPFTSFNSKLAIGISPEPGLPAVLSVLGDLWVLRDSAFPFQRMEVKGAAALLQGPYFHVGICSGGSCSFPSTLVAFVQNPVEKYFFERFVLFCSGNVEVKSKVERKA